MRRTAILLLALLMLLPAVALAKSQTSVDTRPASQRIPLSAEARQGLIDLSRWFADLWISIEKTQSGGSTIYPDPCKDLYGPLLPQCQPERKPIMVVPPCP